MAEDQNLAARWRRSTLVKGGGYSIVVISAVGAAESSVDESEDIVAALTATIDCDC